MRRGLDELRNKLRERGAEFQEERIRRLADPPVRRGPRVWDQSEYREGKGVVTRPVAFPEDIADPTIPKESGIVELPLHIHWWAPFRTYDLDDQLDRETVYREVLTEGTPDDVRAYIRLDELVAMWDDIILPSHVLYVWEPWLRENGYMT